MKAESAGCRGTETNVAELARGWRKHRAGFPQTEDELYTAKYTQSQLQFYVSSGKQNPSATSFKSNGIWKKLLADYVCRLRRIQNCSYSSAYFAVYNSSSTKFEHQLRRTEIISDAYALNVAWHLYRRDEIGMGTIFWGDGWGRVHFVSHAILYWQYSSQVIMSCKTRSSADADNGLDAFVGQSRSTNISGPFQVK